MRVRWLFTLMVTLAPSVATAQSSARSDSLPRELVLALLGGSLGRRGLEVQAGLADSMLPAEVFRDALVLGHSRSPGMNVTVAYFPYPPQPSLDTIKARLVAHGWKLPPQSTEVERGLVSGYQSTFADMLCGPRSVIVPSVNVRTLDRSLVTMAHQTTRAVGDPRCSSDPPVMRRGAGDGLDDSPVPPLSPPSGMRWTGGGSNGTVERGLDMNSSLVGSVPTREVHQHYVQQFLAAGWQQVEQALATDIAVTSFSTTDKDQRRWQVTLVTSTPGGIDEVDVHLTMRMP